MVNLMKSDNEDGDDEKVWGVAYSIEDSDWATGVEAQLDHREKGGYKQTKMLFYPSEPQGSPGPLEVICYVGCLDSSEYAGPAPMSEMAHTILTSVGKSGANKEYLFMLARSLKEIGQSDPHVFDLEKAVMDLEKGGTVAGATDVSKDGKGQGNDTDSLTSSPILTSDFK